ncbi:hypothetical protein CJU90_6585 [Yarrowia sp. C11]|nr:hypothetical protein CJU90_6585 [Yarrowia sp. C11]KAG5358699.1 hypothetical protein CKK34_4962 [Yarrowia sp. E02]
MFRMARSRLMPGLLGLTTATVGLSMTSSLHMPRIYSDALQQQQYVSQQQVIDNMNRDVERVSQQVEHATKKIDYQQLTIGSFVGLISGVVIGKFSKILVWVLGGAGLLIQFLKSRGIVESNPMTSKSFRESAYHKLKGVAMVLGLDETDYQELVKDKPSFNVAFFFSFLVAAWNI